MDLTPFKQINPCGYKELEVVQLSDYIEDVELSKVQQQVIFYLSKNLDYKKVIVKDEYTEQLTKGF